MFRYSLHTINCKKSTYLSERKGAVNTDANGDNNLPGAGEKDEGLAAPLSTLPQRTVTVEELDHTNNSPTNFHGMTSIIH